MYLMKESRGLRIAILDLYDGQANQGMRCIRELLNQYGEIHHLDLHWEEFDVRHAKQVPDLNFDIYISSGGPGSPLDSEGSEWENLYFHWLKEVENYNEDPANPDKKYVLFICHSFQLAVRYFGVANVTKRRSTAFGVFPVHLLIAGKKEPVFKGLADPFYAVDSRDYQVIEGTNPIQYTVGFNDAADKYVRPILDRTKGADNRIIGSAIGDTNGYLPTHLSERSHPQGSDPVWNDEH